jgi:short subunit fatty acids transporter
MPATSCSCPKTIFQRLPTGLTPARILTTLVGLPLLAYLVIHFTYVGSLTLNIVNFFVASGCGLFSVKRQIMLDAPAQLGADSPVAIMAVAYGDQWSNMIQPCWARPCCWLARDRQRAQAEP